MRLEPTYLTLLLSGCAWLSALPVHADTTGWYTFQPANDAGPSAIGIFVEDHGYHTGERTWWNKNTLFERSCRAPLVIAAPGMKGGQTSSSLVEFVDLYPTPEELHDVSAQHAEIVASLTSRIQTLPPLTSKP